MAKKYAVTCIDTNLLPQATRHSSFAVPLPEVFDTREEADAFASAVMQKNAKLQCGINEVEGPGKELG